MYSVDQDRDSGVARPSTAMSISPLDMGGGGGGYNVLIEITLELMQP